MRTKLLSTVAATGALLFMGGTAQALTVSIQLTETVTSPAASYGPTTVASGSTSSGVSYSTGGFGSFTGTDDIIDVGASGTPPNTEPDLTSSVVNVVNTTCTSTCTLTIDVTEVGLTYPTPVAYFNLLNADWLSENGNITSTVFNLYEDNTNAAFGMQNLLGTYVANAQTSGNLLPNVLQDTNPTGFSLTEEYIVTFGTCGDTQTTQCKARLQEEIDGVVPEPASLSLLGGALIAFGAWRRRRKAA